MFVCRSSVAGCHGEVAGELCWSVHPGPVDWRLHGLLFSQVISFILSDGIAARLLCLLLYSFTPGVAILMYSASLTLFCLVGHVGIN